MSLNGTGFCGSLLLVFHFPSPLILLGLSALVSENSVQTEGGRHLCTLCGKVVQAIRQHIRGCCLESKVCFGDEISFLFSLLTLFHFHSTVQYLC